MEPASAIEPLIEPLKTIISMIQILIGGVFGVYVLGWQGLRSIARWDGVMDVLTGIFFTAMGYWILRSWQRLSELETLATVMSLGGTTGPEDRMMGDGMNGDDGKDGA